MVFKPFSGREEHIPAMTKIKNLCKDFSVRFGGHVFPWARIFASWETDEVSSILYFAFIIVGGLAPIDVYGESMTLMRLSIRIVLF